MANRNNVYIGNRYVPVFADPVEWDNLRIYEPLTIVTYQGTSYTSKKAVPAGIALSNTEYWVATGNYNAQVEHYRQEVTTLSGKVTDLSGDVTTLSGNVTNLSGDITNLSGRVGDVEAVSNIFHNKKICVFGDSLYTNYGERTSCFTYLHNLDETIQVTNRAEGGTVIEDLVTSITNYHDLNTFDFIFLGYGSNMWQRQSDTRSMYDAYRNVINYIGTNAPHAHIIALTPYYSTSTLVPDDNNSIRLKEYVDKIIEVCSISGVPTIDFYTQSGVTPWNYTTMVRNDQGYYLHPTDELAHRMARLIYNCSFDRSCTTRHRAIWENSGADGIILSCENNNHYTLNIVGAPTVAWFNSVTLGESFRPSFTPKGMAIGWGGVLGQCTINATTGALTVNFFSGSPDKIGYLNMDWYNR